MSCPPAREQGERRGFTWEIGHDDRDPTQTQRPLTWEAGGTGLVPDREWGDEGETKTCVVIPAAIGPGGTWVGRAWEVDGVSSCPLWLMVMHGPGRCHKSTISRVTGQGYGRGIL